LAVILGADRCPLINVQDLLEKLMGVLEMTVPGIFENDFKCAFSKMAVTLSMSYQCHLTV
jgi:hypothetical protein